LGSPLIEGGPPSGRGGEGDGEEGSRKGGKASGLISQRVIVNRRSPGGVEDFQQVRFGGSSAVDLPEASDGECFGCEAG